MNTIQTLENEHCGGNITFVVENEHCGGYITFVAQNEHCGGNLNLWRKIQILWWKSKFVVEIEGCGGKRTLWWKFNFVVEIIEHYSNIGK